MKMTKSTSVLSVAVALVLGSALGTTPTQAQTYKYGSRTMVTTKRYRTTKTYRHKRMRRHYRTRPYRRTTVRRTMVYR